MNLDFNPAKYNDIIMVMGWAFMVIGATLLIIMAVLHVRWRKERNQ